MARRRKNRRSRRASKASMPNPKRRRRSHRKSARRSRRSYHRNPGPGMWKDLMLAVLAGGAGYLASRKASDMAEQYLPGMIPMHDIVAPALVAAAFIMATEKLVKDPKARTAAQAAAAIPLVEALVNKAGLGHMLGTQKMIVLPAPAAGTSPAALSASLQAQLEDSYSSDY